MQELFEKRVILPLSAIILMQSTIVMSSYGITVVVPDAAGDIGIPPEWVGYLLAVVYAAGSISGLLSGRMVALWGAAAAFRAMMLAVAFGCLALIGATPAFAFLSALCLGLATGPMNPVGSYVLTRISPTRWSAFIFSVKQCATPAGGALAGLILPLIVALWDWQAAFMTMFGVAAILFLAAGAGGLDGETGEHPKRSGGGITESLRLSLAGPQVAATSLAGMLFAGSQVALVAFLVVYLWKKGGLTTAEAGAAFALFHISGVVARLVFGWFAERRISSAALLVVSASGMVLGLLAMTKFTPQTPHWWIFAVVAFAGATGNGWVGLLFAELARLAPPSRAAEVTGGAQVFMYGGVFTTPLACSAVLDATGGNYTAVFTILIGLAVGAAILLEWGRRQRR